MNAASGTSTSTSGGLAQTEGLRVRVHAADPVRRRGLVAMLQAAGHSVTEETPDVELCDVGLGEQPVPHEAEAPVVALAAGPTIVGMPAGMLAADATADQLDLALRAVSAGLLVRSPGLASGAVAQRGFAPVSDEAPPLLTPREREILALVGQGFSNKSVARQLGISVHTVKFHLEALFAKLDATSRAEAVAKGLRGGVIVL
jgi:DNA-binding NarL/FixJ family response regulator